MTDRRTITLDTGRRKVDVPVDALGRERFRARLDSSAIERRDDGAPIGFRGHAAIFNRATQIGPPKWGFREQIAPGAFTKTIQEADVRLLMNHDPNFLLARNKAGTLTLSEDVRGLATVADMAPVSYAQDLAILLERGDISQMSFAFEVIKDQWEADTEESELRTLLEVKLYDVSIVTYPAYEDTDAGLRGAAFDEVCRSAGLDEKARRGLLSAVSNGRPISRMSLTVPESTDEDEDPVALAQAIDATLDSVQDAIDANEPEQVQALLVAAEVTVDALLALLGAPDADDIGIGRSSHEPAKTTRARSTHSQPPEALDGEQDVRRRWAARCAQAATPPERKSA